MYNNEEVNDALEDKEFRTAAHFIIAYKWEDVESNYKVTDILRLAILWLFYWVGYTSGLYATFRSREEAAIHISCDLHCNIMIWRPLWRVGIASSIYAFLRYWLKSILRHGQNIKLKFFMQDISNDLQF